MVEGEEIIRVGKNILDETFVVDLCLYLLFWAGIDRGFMAVLGSGSGYGLDGWMDGVNSKKVHAGRVRPSPFSHGLFHLCIWMKLSLPINGCNGCHASSEVETWNWVDGFSHFHLIMSAYHEILIACSSIIAN